jgi:transposase-like protein
MIDMSKQEPRTTAAAIREAARVSATAPQERPTRRRFTTAFKQRILRELDALAASSTPGGAAALLRREGLGRSLITRWRRQRDAAEEGALGPRKRGPKPVHDSMVDELDRSRREIERLKTRLEKAEVIIDVQKKLSALLGVLTPDICDEKEKP